MLISNSAFLSAEATRKHVLSLNRADARSIDDEWEVAILHGLSMFGQVQYEIPTRSGHKPDVRFWSPTFSSTGDIITVNDSGVARTNPLERFQREFARRALKAGLPHGFHLKVGAREPNSRKGRRDLALPSPAKFDQFFDYEFERFLACVRAAPGKKGLFERRSQGIDIVITYDPASHYFGASFHSYDSPQSPTNNPLYNALNRKPDQLKEARCEGPTLIFACDGGSRSLRSGVGSNVSTAAIVARFLKNHEFTGVVVLTVARRPRMPLMVATPPYLETSTYFHPRTDPACAEEVRSLCARVATALPAPEAEAENALHLLRRKGGRRGRTNWGGWSVTKNSVRLSARSVLELLSGTVSQETFLSDHGFSPSEGRPGMNPLTSFLKQGRLIERVEIERSATADDDWLVLHFGEPDAAATKFVIPSVPELGQ
jgi:hypothetical protein